MISQKKFGEFRCSQKKVTSPSLAEILKKAVAHIFFHHNFFFFFGVKMGRICTNDHICSTFLCKKVLRGQSSREMASVKNLR